MDISKIPEKILNDLRERCTDGEIKESSPEYLFNEYCAWYGLHGWGDHLLYVIDALRAAEK